MMEEIVAEQTEDQQKPAEEQRNELPVALRNDKSKQFTDSSGVEKRG